LPEKSENSSRQPRRNGAALQQALERINRRWGRDTLQYAYAGLRKARRHKQARKSPAYPTQLAGTAHRAGQLPRIRPTLIRVSGFSPATGLEPPEPGGARRIFAGGSQLK